MQMVTFGFYAPRWERSDYPKLTGVGLFDAWSFDPLTWKPNYPNPAFLMMDREDAFWAAKQVAAFTDDEIRAMVETGEYSDPRATDWITECLIKRRDKIAQAWFCRSSAAGQVSHRGWEAGVRRSQHGAARRHANTTCAGRVSDDNRQLTPTPGRQRGKIPPSMLRTIPGGNDRMRQRRRAPVRTPVTVYLRRWRRGPK